MMTFGDFNQLHNYSGKEESYARTGFSWLQNHQHSMVFLSRREAKDYLKEKVISEIKQEYNLGPIASLLLWWFFQKLVERLFLYWWNNLT